METKNIQSAISKERKIVFALHRTVNSKINSSLLENTPLNENYEFSSYQGKEKSEESDKINRLVKMGNFISKYPKQRRMKFVKPVLSNTVKSL